MSIGQLCDDNCIVIFTKNNTYITKHGKLIKKGYRNQKDGLWDLKSTGNITQQLTVNKSHELKYNMEK